MVGVVFDKLAFIDPMIMVGGLLIGGIVAYAVAWWRVLEEKPDPIRDWGLRAKPR